MTLNELILKVQRIPSLLLGFIVILIVIVALVYNDPPTTVCDVQMQEVNSRLAQGFFEDSPRSGGYEKGVMQAFDICLQSNSPGGCHDMFQRLDFLESLLKTIPAQCGSHSSTAAIRGALAKALRLFAMIAWGETPPKNQYNKTSWLDTADLGLFCRLKRQFIRLYGKSAWEQFAWGFLPTLPEVKTLQKREVWQRSLFSYQCTGLY